MTLDDLEGSLCTLFQNTFAVVLLFIYFLVSRSVCFLQMIALTSRKLKQIKVKSYWAQDKHAISLQYSTALVLLADRYSVASVVCLSSVTYVLWPNSAS